MRAKSVALLVLALGCGLVASVGVTQVMDRRNHSEESTETATVFVAVKNVAMGEPLNATMVRPESWPKDKVPKDAITKLEDLEGRRCVTRLLAGEIIFHGKLTDKFMGVSPSIPKGFRLITVKVDAVTGSASMILPGDRVDVLCQLRPTGPGNPEPITRTILQYVKVFAVDAVVSLEAVDGDGKTIPAKTVTLLVTPDQAQRIALATELGSVRLVLRPIDDSEQVTVDSTTASQLLGLSKANDRTTLPPTEPAIEAKMVPDRAALAAMMKSKESKKPVLLAQAEPPAPNPPASQRYVMRLLLGTKCSEVVMESQADTSGAPATKKLWRTRNGDAASAEPAASAVPLPEQSRETNNTENDKSNTSDEKASTESGKQEKVSSTVGPRTE